MYINDDVSCNRFKISHESKYKEMFYKNVDFSMIQVKLIVEPASMNKSLFPKIVVCGTKIAKDINECMRNDVITI